MDPDSVDIVVIGAGNAGLCAAIAARVRGANVLVLEKACRELRGGNSSLTTNFRFAYRNLDELAVLLPPKQRERLGWITPEQHSYSPDAFLQDLLRCGADQVDAGLLTCLAEKSYETIRWLHSFGHQWEVKQHPVPGSVPIRLLGGGHQLQTRSFAVAESLGVDFRYGTAASRLRTDARGHITGVLAETGGLPLTLSANAVILACGGFQAHSEMRERHLGPRFRNVNLRGIPYNTGDGHRMALQVGCARAGDWSTCHIPPQDPEGPPYAFPGQHELCQAQSRYSFHYGVMVDRFGRRFVDEGEFYANHTYARMGREILKLNNGLAFQIFDGKAISLGLVQPSYRSARGTAAEDLVELARGLGIAIPGFLETIMEYNDSVRDVDHFRPGCLGGPHTEGLQPPKSNWALTIDTPPFIGVPVTGALTFTYGGIRIDRNSRCLDRSGSPIPGLYAAGEVVGGLFYRDYPGGSGMMAGAVYGRTAGEHAARVHLS